MFTGLVEEVGRIRAVSRDSGNHRLEVQAALAAALKIGDSLAVNGCCLTVTETCPGHCVLEVTQATVRTTTLDRLRAGSRVNLERALAVGGRLGGHFVQGHVDEVAQVSGVERRTGYHELRVRLRDSAHRNLLIPRGSVCVDGVSLTIASVARNCFAANVIPHTWKQTILGDYRAGTPVNVEFDLLVKAVASRLGAGS